MDFSFNTCLAWIPAFRRRREWGKKWAVVHGVVSEIHGISDNESKYKYFCLWEIQACSRMWKSIPQNILILQINIMQNENLLSGYYEKE